MSKEERAKIAERLTLQREREQRDAISFSFRKLKSYTPEQLQNMYENVSQGVNKTNIVLESKTSEEAIQTLYSHLGGARTKIGVLDFASFLSPGGGYINGAIAQEEALCASSFLYNVLSKKNKWYFDNRKKYKNGGLYDTRLLYVPKVLFDSKDDKSIPCNVIVCAAPNKAVALMNGISVEEVSDTLLERVRAVLTVAAEQKCTDLVLGAFGCGVFDNDPSEVAIFFLCELYTAFSGVFNSVTFAIPIRTERDSVNYNAFRHEISKAKKEYEGIECNE